MAQVNYFWFRLLLLTGSNIHLLFTLPNETVLKTFLATMESKQKASILQFPWSALALLAWRWTSGLHSGELLRCCHFVLCTRWWAGKPLSWTFGTYFNCPLNHTFPGFVFLEEWVECKTSIKFLKEKSTLEIQLQEIKIANEYPSAFCTTFYLKEKLITPLRGSNALNVLIH